MHFTIINMPLVRTPMIAPTKIYDEMPTVIAPDEAADMIADAIIRKPQRIATRLGVIAEIMHLIDAEDVRGRDELRLPDVPGLRGGAGQEGQASAAAAGDQGGDDLRLADARHTLVAWLRPVGPGSRAS